MGIIVYGTGSYGRLTKKLLNQNGKEVDFFVDRNCEEADVDGVRVITPEEIPYGCDDKIYVAVKNHYSEIYSFLKKRNCSTIASIEALLEITPFQLPLNLTQRERDAYFARRSYSVAVRMNGMRGIKFNHVEAVVTERCTLKCRDCSSLMPYYKNPVDLDVEELLGCIINLLSVVTYVGEIRILGGEPFLNKNIDHLISGLSNSDKIGFVSVYTNGMANPEDRVWEMLADSNVMVHVSDYGIGKKARDIFINKCEEYGLNFFARKYDEWFRMGEVKANGFSEEILNKTFKNCSAAACPTILGGKLYQCPRMAHADQSGLFKSPQNEYVDIAKDIGEEQKALIYQIANQSCMPTICRFCQGTCGQTIAAAIQV